MKINSWENVPDLFCIFLEAANIYFEHTIFRNNNNATCEPTKGRGKKQHCQMKQVNIFNFFFFFKHFFWEVIQ